MKPVVENVQWRFHRPFGKSSFDILKFRFIFIHDARRASRTWNADNRKYIKKNKPKRNEITACITKRIFFCFFFFYALLSSNCSAVFDGRPQKTRFPGYRRHTAFCWFRSRFKSTWSFSSKRLASREGALRLDIKYGGVFRRHGSRRRNFHYNTRFIALSAAARRFSRRANIFSRVYVLENDITNMTRGISYVIYRVRFIKYGNIN